MSLPAPDNSTAITYRRDIPLDPAAIARVFDSSGLKRPTGDLPRIARMFENANLVFSAWRGDELVGVARSVTDFSWCCYLADLAVVRDLQRAGVGRELIRLTQEVIGPGCSFVLISAPEAMEYYPKVGFEKLERGFVRWRTQ